MPYILSIPKEDRDFRKGVTTWFESMSVKVPGKLGSNPVEGLPLEIGMEKDNSQPVSAENLPINITDFIKWRHALGHPWIANSEETGKGNQLKQYYIFDPNAVSKVNISINEQRDKALGYYLTIKDNIRSVTMYLTLLGVRTNQLRKGEEVIELRKLVDKDPDKFIRLYNDKDKEMKYIIEEMVNNNILERVSTRVLIKENGEQIGRDTQETVLYMLDSRNTKVYNALKARLQEAWKKTSVSVETDEDLPAAKTPAPVPEPVDEVVAAKEIIPAAAPEEQVAMEGSAGQIDE